MDHFRKKVGFYVCGFFIFSNFLFVPLSICEDITSGNEKTKANEQKLGALINTYLLLLLDNKPDNKPPVFVNYPSAATATVATFIKVPLTVSLDDTDGPQALSYRWSKIEGPGTASFTSPTLAQTEVSFNLAGKYKLKLTCSDGEHTTSSYLWITAYGPSTDWRNAAFSRSQNTFDPPDSYESVPELALPSYGGDDATGLTFNEYAQLGVDKCHDDYTWYINLGPCGASHLKAVQFMINGNPRTYDQDKYDWTKPEPDVPVAIQPSHHGYAMVGHQFSGTSHYPGIIAFDHYGVRPMPLYEDEAAFGTTFRITGYKAARSDESFPQLIIVDFSVISNDEMLFIVDISHRMFEGAACVLAKVADNAPMTWDTGMVIYPRADISAEDLAIWTFSSMNWKDQDPDEYAADCDTLVYGNPAAPTAMAIDNPFPDSEINYSINSPEFVGLKIVNGRTEVPDSPYAEARYWTRPDMLLTLFGEISQLKWDLTVFPTNYEGDDNVVLTARNASPLAQATTLENGYAFFSQLSVERPQP